MELTDTQVMRIFNRLIAFLLSPIVVAIAFILLILCLTLIIGILIAVAPFCIILVPFGILFDYL